MKNRKEVQAVLIGQQGYLIVKKVDKPYWRLIKGGVNKSESDEEALKREITEELELTNIKIANKISNYAFTHEDTKHIVTTYYTILEKNQEIRLDKKELSDYKWVPIKQTAEELEFEQEKNIIHLVMQSKMQKLIQELKSLNFPTEEFAVFGSGPISIRGLKELGDLDVIVTQKLWKQLSIKYGITEKGNYHCISIGDIDFFEYWTKQGYNIDQLIKEADIIDNIRYVKLEKVLEWKKGRNLPKDKKDVELIEEFLKA